MAVSYAEQMKTVIKGLEGIPTLLLHVCCAPCSTVALEALAAHFDLTLYYYNPNIESEEEYERRASEVVRLVHEMKPEGKIKVKIAPFDPEAYRNAVKGLEREKEGGKRCEACFRLRLNETAAEAKKSGFRFFSTTLSTGPMKNAALLNAIGLELEQSYGVRFLPADFKKEGGFARSLELSAQYGLYRQNYCGCTFSKEEVMKKRMIDALSKQERVFALIDTEAYRENVRTLISRLCPGSKAFLVLKADAYGHGAVRLMKAASSIEGVYGAAVATVEEALELRSVTTKPILILGPIPKARASEAVANDIELTVFTEEQAKCLSEAAAALKKTAKIHVKVDTGMHRIGLTADSDGISLVKRIVAYPGLKPEGVFTHLATMDEADPKEALRQAERFRSFTEELKQEGITFPHIHLANSAAVLRQGGFPFADLVRLGISQYGPFPSEEIGVTDLKLRPVMSLYATVTYVKTLPAGQPIGYGGTFVTEKPTKVATVSCGYGDGYLRALSNRGEVVIRNMRCRILGRVCMDQFMVDVTALKTVNVGDPVLLFGGEGEQALPVEEVAKSAGTISYELLTDVSKRVKRFEC